MDTGADSERTLNCEEGEDWKWLVDQLEAMTTARV